MAVIEMPVAWPVNSNRCEPSWLISSQAIVWNAERHCWYSPRATRIPPRSSHQSFGNRKEQNPLDISNTVGKNSSLWFGLDAIAPDAYHVIYHEYVHMVLQNNFRWLPLWLNEGLAEFYGNTRFEQSKIYVGAPSSNYRYLQDKSLMPIDTLLAVNKRS